MPLDLQILIEVEAFIAYAKTLLMFIL